LSTKIASSLGLKDTTVLTAGKLYWADLPVHGVQHQVHGAGQAQRKPGI